MANTSFRITRKGVASVFLHLLEEIHHLRMYGATVFTNGQTGVFRMTWIECQRVRTFAAFDSVSQNWSIPAQGHWRCCCSHAPYSARDLKRWSLCIENSAQVKGLSPDYSNCRQIIPSPPLQHRSFLMLPSQEMVNNTATAWCKIQDKEFRRSLRSPNMNRALPVGTNTTTLFTHVTRSYVCRCPHFGHSQASKI